jgi:hypothetical protein
LVKVVKNLSIDEVKDLVRGLNRDHVYGGGGKYAASEVSTKWQVKQFSLQIRIAETLCIKVQSGVLSYKCLVYPSTTYLSVLSLSKRDPLLIILLCLRTISTIFRCDPFYFSSPTTHPLHYIQILGVSFWISIVRINSVGFSLAFSSATLGCHMSWGGTCVS